MRQRKDWIMSDRKDDATEKVDQDLQNLAYGRTQAEKAPFAEGEATSGELSPDQADRSLANIHTGDKNLHDESFTGRDDGAGTREGAEYQSNLQSENLDETVAAAAEANPETSEILEQGEPVSFQASELRDDNTPESADGSFGFSENTVPEQNYETDAGLQSQANTELEPAVAEVDDEENIVDQAPVPMEMDGGSIMENAAVGELVGTVSTFDAEGGPLTYTLVDDADGRFSIDPETGEIRVAGDLDYETASSHELIVEVTDGTNVVTQPFVINVGDENEAPENLALDDNNIIENAAVGEVVGTVSATDQENNSLTYSLSDDADGRFAINSVTGEITVAGGLDHENADSHEITVEVSDGTNVTTQTFTINVGDENEAPEALALDDNNIIENAALGDVVGTVSATDPENDSLTYSLSDDAGGRFTIDANTGELIVAGNLDYETATSHEVTVEVYDGEFTITQTFTINVGDENEAPENLSLDNASIDEHSDVGAIVGKVSASDVEGDSLTYSLSDDANGLFAIDPVTGEISVAGDIDYETATSHELVVDVSDGANTVSQIFTIDVADVAPPDLEGRGNTVDYQNVGEAVDLDHMDVFPDLHSPGDLEARIGTETFEELVSDANDVFINYQSDATLTFHGEYAGYRNSIGGYQVDSEGNITGVQLLWGDASNDKLTADESTATYTDIDQGNQLGFFVIPNGFSKIPDCSFEGDGNTMAEGGTWMFVTSDFNAATDNPADHVYNINEDSGAPRLIYVDESGDVHGLENSERVYHSTHQDQLNPETNVEDRDHFVAGVDAENGLLHMGFEDLYAGGDNDFNDGMFSVEIDVRDLVQVPNSLFAEDNNGQSTFQISGDGDMSEVIVTLTNCLDGDQINFSGGFEIVDGNLQLVDGTALGLQASIVDAGGTITVTVTGDGSADLYESVVQSLNFYNPDQGVDISGVRDVAVTGVDGNGEETNLVSTTITVGEDQVITGTDADDTLTGAFGDDTLNGGAGADEISAGAGNDSVAGGGGDDEIHADGGYDSVDGGDGDDTIYGGTGDDTLSGGAGADVVHGDAGSDMFHFGLDDGMDTFHGGDGGGWSDTIVLSDGLPAGEVGDWLSLTSGHVESVQDGEIFLSEDAAGVIDLGGDAVLTFDGVEKIEI